MDNLLFLQQYWWFVISLLGGLLVFLLFVQGANSQLYTIPNNSLERSLMINATGRKWELTFTTLVVFGGAFFASFPLFYSTSFGGAYWLWMVILFTFVLQAVSYEFQAKSGNLLGRHVYQFFLVLNGLLGPFLLGVAVSMFFVGAPFTMDKANIVDIANPIISRWHGGLYGLEALGNVWNLLFGVAVLFLSRSLGALFLLQIVDDVSVHQNTRKMLWINVIVFLVSFLVYFVHLMLSDGYGVNPENGEVFLESYKYYDNLISLPIVFALLVLGVILLLIGIVRGLFFKKHRDGFWWSGIGTVLSVMSLFMISGYNNTCYYPSQIDPFDSLTLQNSSSSLVTLQVMFYVSLLIPIVLCYIIIAWRWVDRRKVSSQDLSNPDADYH